MYIQCSVGCIRKELTLMVDIFCLIFIVYLQLFLILFACTDKLYTLQLLSEKDDILTNIHIIIYALLNPYCFSTKQTIIQCSKSNNVYFDFPIVNSFSQSVSLSLRPSVSEILQSSLFSLSIPLCCSIVHLIGKYEAGCFGAKYTGSGYYYCGWEAGCIIIMAWGWTAWLQEGALHPCLLSFCS